MSEQQRCPQCDAEIPANSPIGLCPRCLLLAANDSQSAAAEPGPTKLTPPAPASGFVPPTPQELAPLFPQLEILELLGKGGMGAVYKARQPGLDRLVALKILPPEISHDPAFVERFQREARALARLSHPHIVTVYDFGIVGQAFQTDALARSGQAGKPDLQGGLCYIVMEFVDGANLRQAIQTKTLTSAEALAIVPQICEALQFAHDEGIVHRDIKPENILIDKRGRVKIADFGLAKLLGQDASDHSLTATHQVMGTLRYMAPEQMQGSREVDHRADIYSLGVVFYELLTGELPMGRFAPPSKRVQVDVRLDEIVLRALEQEPEQRYQHVSQVRDDVERVTSTPVLVSIPTSTTPSQRTERSVPAGAEKTGTGPVPLPGPHLVQGPADCLLLAAGIAFVTACGVAVWLGVTASRENNFSTSMVRGNLIGMSVALATYSLFVGGAGLMLRRLRARLTVLLIAVIVGLFFPAVCALNVVMELRNIPVWPVVIPLWLGMPAALWVVVRLFRDDVRGAFDAAEQRRLRDFSNPPQQTPSFASEPRYSRFAIAGAVWALFGLLAIIPTLYFIGLNRVWNGTALPTDVIHSEPPLVFSIFMGALLAIGSGAPIGTTIFGAIVIGHIKRSGGKIIGLPLAVADVLFFPLLVLSGIIAALVAQVVFAIAPHPNAAAVTSAGALGVLVALVVCFFVVRAVWRAIHPTGALVVRERSAGAWSVLEIVTGVVVAMMFVLAAVKGIYELAQSPCPLDVVAVPVAALAALAAGVLLVVHQIHRPSGSRTALPELFIAILAACAGSLSWTAVFSPIAGWNFWQGAVFASLNFVLSLFLLMAGNSRPRTRAVFTLLVGLMGFALVMWFNVGPVGVIGGDAFLTTITRKPGLPGMFIAAALGLLAMISGALQLRSQPNAEDTPPPKPSAAVGVTHANGLGRISLWSAMTGVVLPALLLIGGTMLSSRVSIGDGFLVVCFLPGVGLELVAFGCGIVARGTKSGKAGLIIGSISLALCPIPLTTHLTRDSTHNSHPDAISESTLVSLPPLGTITNGIGVEFTVPAGQVATFEIVTRRDNETVPVPPHCAYLLASVDKPVAGQFRWSRKLEEAVAGSHSNWRIEMRTAGGGGGFSEATLLPDELNAAVGARGISLGLLEPNEETIHWGSADVNDLPANGLIGLRVTVVAHGLKGTGGGSGTAHIDWKKAQSAESTTRRKLPSVAP